MNISTPSNLYKKHIAPSKIFKTNPLDHSFVRPNLILEKRNGDVIGKLIYEDLSFNLLAVGASDFQITVHKVNDNNACGFWDEIKDLQIINWVGFKRFVIDIDLNESTEIVKHINCVSLEADELSQAPLRNFHVNDEEAMTTLDPDNKFKPTMLYVKGDPEHSLLDRILKAKTKHWQVNPDGVDEYFNVNGKIYRAANLQREFTIDRQTPYDLLEGDVSKECGCTFVYDTYNRLVNCYNTNECVFDTTTMEVVDDVFYDLDTHTFYKYEDGNKVYVTGNYEYLPGIGDDTTIMLTSTRLSEDVTVDSDKDSIKNCFYVTGGDDVITNYVAASNASGTNYIYNFDYQYDLMSNGLVEKIKDYQEFYKEKETAFNKVGGVFVYDSTVYYDNTSKCYKDGNANIIVDDNIRKVDGKICVLSPYSYYENGTCYNEDGTIITTTHTYEEPGLYIEYCQAVDRLAYWEHNKFPNMTVENTTATSELAKLKTYLQNNPIIITNACNTNSFSHVTLLIENICNVVVDNRYTVKTDKYASSCDKINNDQGFTQGYWTGKITITRDTDETDFAEEQSLSVLVKKSQNGTEDIDYCNQKIKIALAKMDASELPLTYNMYTEDDDNELRALFSEYNLQSLRAFRESFSSCNDVLTDLKTQMLSTDDERQEYLSAAFDKAFEIYENRKNICIEYSGASSTESTSDTTVVGITEAIVNKWQAEVDRLSNEIVEFQQTLNIEEYLGDYYTEFLSFVREDEYNNGNYNSNNLGDADILYWANELRKVATAELKKASKIHYTISGTINNIFNIDQLSTIKDNFCLFNYVRYIVDGKIYKLRLLGISGNENSLDTISITFGDVVSCSDNPAQEEQDKLNAAASMSTSYNSTTLQARQGSSAYNSVGKMKAEGLNSAEYIIKNSNAEIIHDDHGSLYKTMDDTNVFAENQLRITPAGVYLTDDAWKTTGMAVGTVIMTNPTTGLKQKYFGVIADYIYGNLIAGNGLEIANENGSVNITGDGIELDGGSITWKTKLPQSSVTDLVDDLAEITSELSELDDRIETFSQTTDPSTDWDTTELKEKHLSDLWFNPTDGLTKRWTKSGTTYKWETVTDSDLVALAQSKATVFVSKPTSGYRAKDLWILEKDNSGGTDTTYPQYKKGSVLISNTTSTTYNKSHWKEDVRYTDDTTANQALADARQGIADAAGALARANAVDTAAQGYANTAESNAKNASDPRGSASSAENNAKTYADDKDTALSTALTAAYQNYTDTAVANLDTEVGKYLGLGGTTIVSDTYLVSPYIGGGYLNITNGQKQVIIDPKNLGNTNYIFAVKNGSEFTVGIKADGTTNIKGGITATSLTITDQTKVTGMKIPKTYTYAYANSTTNSQPADSAFSSTQNPEPGKYMWIRTTISYTDSTITPDKTYYSTYIGKNGTDGTNGNDGASVTAVRVMYARSNSNSTAPTSGWSENRPTLTNTYKYVWVREDYKYSTAPDTWILGVPRFDSIITAECGVPLVIESTSTGVKVHPIDNTGDYLHITSDSVNVAINNYTKAHFGSDGIWIGGKSNSSATSDSYVFKVDANGNGYFAGELKAATGSFSGNLTSTSGTIGSWTINSNSLGSLHNIDNYHAIDFELIPGSSRIQLTYTDTSSSLGEQHIYSWLTYNGLFFENDLLGNDCRVSYRNDGIYYYDDCVMSFSGQQMASIAVGVVTGDYSIGVGRNYDFREFSLSSGVVTGLCTNGDFSLRERLFVGNCTGAGASSPTDYGHALNVNGNGYFSGTVYTLGHPTLYSSGSGATAITGMELVPSNNYIQVGTGSGAYGINVWVSDTKLKKNIKPSEKTALDKINSIDFIQFDWKKDDGHVDLGISANQVQEIIPEAIFEVSQPEDSEYDSIKNVDSGVMITYALKAIQEQQEITKELKERIKQLEEGK